MRGVGVHGEHDRVKTGWWLPAVLHGGEEDRQDGYAPSIELSLQRCSSAHSLVARDALLENQLQRREVVVDAVLDREPGELRHECRYPVKLHLGVELQDGLAVLRSEVVAVEKRGRSCGRANRELAWLVARNDLELVGGWTRR